MIATEACRLAVNGADFVERVRRDVGLDLEIVDRQTEAYLAVTGCAALADPQAESVVIFDIGGGSTEIAWLDGAAANPSADPTLRIRAWDSLPVGRGDAGRAPRRGRGHPADVRGHGRGGGAMLSRLRHPGGGGRHRAAFPPARHLRHGDDARRHAPAACRATSAAGSTVSG